MYLVGNTVDSSIFLTHYRRETRIFVLLKYTFIELLLNIRFIEILSTYNSWKFQ